MQNSNPLHSNYFAKKDMEWHNLVSILSFDFYGPSCQYLQRMGMSSFFGLTLFFFSPLPPFLKNPHTNCTPNSYFIEWTKWSASQLSQVSYHWASNGGFKVDLMNRSKSFDENIVCLVHFVFTPICHAVHFFMFVTRVYISIIYMCMVMSVSVLLRFGISVRVHEIFTHWRVVYLLIFIYVYT